ncbi:MAG: succinyl-diaminopimelate desuccinylase [Actinomycetota bacterium]|nr:succinyl-diaminopimelate desuccinylase [Actinomycetota bacterium]
MADLDLLARTAELVDIPSESHDEAAITAHIEDALRALPHLQVDRVGDNLVARTQLGRSTRVLLAGHTDTVPANGNAGARIDGDVLWGLGAADMKSGLAVMLALAETVPEPAVDVTWIFYAGEEVAAEHNGLRHLVEQRPDLLAGDVAILGEPTSAAIEAGCQGTLRLELTLRGARAHTARPWMGRNAIHRMGEALRLVESFPERRPVLDGCEYREALQAVLVSGGVAGNVVPDLASLTINRRFAPDRSEAEAEQEVRDLLAPVLEEGDELRLLDAAGAAAPSLEHPVLRTLIEQHGLEVRAKLGWTDVARFAAAGVPACNLGPGDATLAHTAEERVDRAAVERTYEVLRAVLSDGPT